MRVITGPVYNRSHPLVHGIPGGLHWIDIDLARDRRSAVPGVQALDFLGHSRWHLAQLFYFSYQQTNRETWSALIVYEMNNRPDLYEGQRYFPADIKSRLEKAVRIPLDHVHPRDIDDHCNRKMRELKEGSTALEGISADLVVLSAFAFPVMSSRFRDEWKLYIYRAVADLHKVMLESDEPDLANAAVLSGMM